MDIRIPLAGVLVAGGLLGLAMPMIADDDAAQGSVADGAQVDGHGDGETLAMVGSGAGSATWATETVLDRASDGHFYADVVVDGTTARMMVDTGASVIALTGEDAAAMGLYWDASEVGPVARGASGAVHGVQTRLNRVTVGNFEAHDVEALIIPEGLGISLLGQSFLSTVQSVEIADDRMMLES
ncbi:aspartyl protease-like protein [Aurantiacibacter atlanticus]|uniref:Aspartyl protease-like protein n=1 Tax=Aurantiacibacter atlanticus TaxID=1648404 RepID=A0A161I433_9SPHN|nr:TIGR02281 family clan AA aspartic protease [Aurantiacibacter atlanticus]ANC50341.1 aspartyl protease-like protein [Aurantiacibacter atlanticus]MDF1833903.1 TIGR02281 family clan AA aspartic protease [Alteraurantiacibacter sp. bin_em_oilr2.035]